MKVFEKLMTMDNQTWARHTNPWSVYSRFTILPFLALSIWSRDWIGEWCLLPIGLTIFWIWFNPRAFPPPKSTNNWASKGPMGEQIYLNSPQKVPKFHKIFIRFMSAVSLLGVIIMAYGVYELLIWPTLYGMTLSMLAKAWVVDRMVWIYDQVK